MNEYNKTESKIAWKQAVIILAVTSIFVLIAGFMIMYAKRENRDLKRIADIKTIQHALELYYYDCNYYPSKIDPGATISGVENCNGSVYLKSVPFDPKLLPYRYLPCRDEASKDCSQGIQKPLSYQIYYDLESNTEDLAKGPHMATPERFLGKE